MVNMNEYAVLGFMKYEVYEFMRYAKSYKLYRYNIHVKNVKSASYVKL